MFDYEIRHMLRLQRSFFLSHRLEKNANRIGDSVCVWLSYNHSLGEKNVLISKIHAIFLPVFVALPKMCLCLNVSLEIWRKIGQCNQKCSNESSVKCTALISKWCGGGWVHILWCMYILMPTLLASDSFSRHLTLRLSVCMSYASGKILS